MTEAFLLLSKEKQKKILDAAMYEFAESGFQKASTNRIVQAAGIGKGMLFYYFDSKLRLYEDLVLQCCAMLEGYCETLRVPAGTMGVIERFRHATQMKMEAQVRHAAMFAFVARMYLSPEDVAMSEETKERFAAISAAHHTFVSEMVDGADLTNLREDVPVERLLQVLRYVMDGYATHVVQQIEQKTMEEVASLDFAPYWADCEIFLEDLKRLFYKN